MNRFDYFIAELKRRWVFRMLKTYSAIGLIFLFFIGHVPLARAQETVPYIDTFYEGAPAPGMHETPKERWGYMDLAERDLISIFYARGPTGFGGEPEDVAWLARNGIDILYQLWFWHEHEYNIWDVYYNYEFCQDTVKAAIDYHFNWLDPDSVWGVRLGDEEPAGGGYRWRLTDDPLPDDLARYGPEYFQETGNVLKSPSQMSQAEYQRFFEWANAKDTWVLNWVYDYVKDRWSHLEVFQNVFARPLDWAYAEPYYLKADGFMYDHYTTEIDGFWDVYNTTRYYKTIFPGKPFHMMLWGISHAPEMTEPADRVVFMKMAWATYLAGAEGIGWFTGDSVGLNYWQTTEAWAMEDYEYLNALNQDLMQLTPFTPQPKVLVIGLGPAGIYRLGLFKEYATVSEDFLAVRDFDLTLYDILFVFGEVHYDSVVTKLNDYVLAGGNLVLATTLLPQTPAPEYGRRSNKFLFEEHGYGTDYGLAGEVAIEADSTDTLKFWFNYNDPSFQSAAFAVTQDSGYFYPIGRYIIGGNEYTEGYPSFLYRAQPDHGWTLYNGYVRYDHSHEQAMLIWNTFFRAFALNFLNMPESITTGEQQGTLISPAKIAADRLLVGMVNDTTAKAFSYTLNLERFGLSDGLYYVYLWENSQSYGEFTSDQGMLTFPIELAANDVQLFVVSEQPLGIVSDDAPLRRFALSQNYPNPFNPSTTLAFELPMAADVRLVIYDILGREVVELLDRPMTAGQHRVVWNGKTKDGKDVSSGIYIARMVIPPSAGVIPPFTSSIKLVLLR